MWQPTHVQVTVQKASGLLIKGKNDTNDCFVTIALGKTKYQTSVKEKAPSTVEWHEECELPIPDHGNTAEIILTALHRNFIGVDEFLGRVSIPLNSLDTYERPKNRWYTLQSKPGQEAKAKDRGQLEVKIGFTVKSGSLMDLSKKEKHKSSMGQLSHMASAVGGSLLSITSVEKRKGIKKFAKSIGSKMNLKGKKKDLEDDNSSFGSANSLQHRNNFEPKFKSKQTFEDADPGVVSEDDEFTFDDLSHKSSGSSLNQSQQSTANKDTFDVGEDTLRKSNTLPKLPRNEHKLSVQDEWEQKLYRKQGKNVLKSNSSDPMIIRTSWESPKLSSRIEEEDAVEIVLENLRPTVNTVNTTNKTPEAVVKVEKESLSTKFKNFRKGKSESSESKAEKASHYSDRLIIGGENEQTHHPINSKISNELLRKFEGKTREDLILSVCEMQHELDHSKKKLKDLEDYLDELLLRVMETTPRILQNPYVNCKLAHKKLTG